MKATGIEKQVIKDIKERQKLGINKYGTTVKDNPLNHKEWLQHAYEEALDMAVYLKRAMSEIEKNGLHENLYLNNELPYVKSIEFSNIINSKQPSKSKPNKSLSIEKEVVSGECIGCMFDDICEYDQHDHICNPFVQDEIFGINCSEHRVIFKLKEVKR